MQTRANVPFGIQALTVAHVQVSGNRVSFVFSTPNNDCNEVIRTFTMGTGQLAAFMESLYSARKDSWTESDFKNLIGRTVVAEIGPARNPMYVNLVRIVEAQHEPGGKGEGSILTAISQSTDSNQVPTTKKRAGNENAR